MIVLDHAIELPRLDNDVGVTWKIADCHSCAAAPRNDGRFLFGAESQSRSDLFCRLGTADEIWPPSVNRMGAPKAGFGFCYGAGSQRGFELSSQLLNVDLHLWDAASAAL